MYKLTVVVQDGDRVRVLHCFGTTREELRRDYRAQVDTLGPKVIAVFDGMIANIKAKFPEFSECDPGGL